LKFAVITLFPELLKSFLAAGVIGRAVKDNKIDVSLFNPRDYTGDKHRTVDDRPFGSGNTGRESGYAKGPNSVLVTARCAAQATDGA